MITGFNTDVKHKNRVFHIQTEDKGAANPYVESLVYVGGEILATKRTSYAEILRGPDDPAVQDLMEQQHRTMIAAIKRGRLDHPADETKFKTPRATVSAPAPASAKSAGSATDEKTLDHVIIDYLASEAESEHLELSLLNQADFYAGAPVEIKVATRRSLSQNPIPAASIEVKVISTVEPPRVVFRGKTAADGTVLIRCTIPAFREGTAAVIISAQSQIGNDEVKQLVKKKK